jgi:hypothetical protein
MRSTALGTVSLWTLCHLGPSRCPHSDFSFVVVVCTVPCEYDYMHVLDLSAQLWVFLHDTLNVTHRVLRCWQA